MFVAALTQEEHGPGNLEQNGKCGGSEKWLDSGCFHVRAEAKSETGTVHQGLAPQCLSQDIVTRRE